MAVYFNQIIVAGNMVADAELAKTNNGTPVTNFRMAINTRIGGDQEKVTFIDVTVFGKLAEIVCQYARKGSGVLVSGRLDEDQWEKDGVRHFKHFITAEYFRVLSGFKDRDEEKSW